METQQNEPARILDPNNNFGRIIPIQTFFLYVYRGFQ